MTTLIKKIFVITCFALSLVGVAKAGIILTLTPDSDTINEGDALIMDVLATTTNGSAFTSFGFDLLQDSVQLLATDMDVSIASEFISFPSGDFDGLNGTVPLAPGQFFPTALQGSNIRLATISIAGLVEGDYQFNLATTLTDLNEGVFNADLNFLPGFVMIDPASFTPVSISVKSVTAPATSLLLGLVGLLITVRRVRTVA